MFITSMRISGVRSVTSLLNLHCKLTVTPSSMCSTISRSFSFCSKPLECSHTRSTKSTSGNTVCKSKLRGFILEPQLNCRAGSNSSSGKSTTSRQHKTVEHVCQTWTDIFEKNDVQEARLSIEYIVAFVLGKKTLHGVSGGQTIGEEDMKMVDNLCKERLQHKPLQYILGECDFCDIELKMRPPVFVPRPETEKLIEMAVEMLENKGLQSGRVLELCCGSGAISLSLLHKLPQLQCVAVDISSQAVSLTQENAQLLGLSHRISILLGDLTEESAQERLRGLGPFDMLVSNPPYISSHALPSLEPQVFMYEDHRALDGGHDGLDIVRSILRLAPTLLHHNSDILLEIDPGQPRMIREMVTSTDPADLYVDSYLDYLNRERFCHVRTLPSEQTQQEQ